MRQRAEYGVVFAHVTRRCLAPYAWPYSIALARASRRMVFMSAGFSGERASAPAGTRSAATTTHAIARATPSTLTLQTVLRESLVPLRANELLISDAVRAVGLGTESPVQIL